MNIFNKLSLRGKIIMSNVITLSLSIAVSVFGVMKYSSLVKDFKFLTEVTFENVMAQGDMNTAVADLKASVNLLIGSKNTKEEAQHVRKLADQAIADFEKAQKTYEDLPFVEGEEAVWKDFKATVWEPYKQIVNKMIDLSLQATEESYKLRDLTASGDFAELDKVETEKFDKLIAFQKTFSKQHREDDAKTSEMLSWLIPVLLLSFGFLSIIMAILFSNTIANSLLRMAEQLKQSGTEVTSAASSIANASQELSQATTEQAASLEQTAASVEEMTSMVSKSADNARETTASSEESQQKAQQGQQVVEQMMVSMQEINESNEKIKEQVENSNTQIGEIVKIIEDIGNKTKVINDIVFQTKLLSFNASVEAARAGEAGKGFAVVAEEVGNLAAMSGNAANEISSMLAESKNKVNAIVSETQTKVSTLISEGKNKVEMGSEIARQCGEVLNEIVDNVSRVAQMSSEISTANQEQSTGITEINKAVGQLDQVTQQNAATTDQVASAANQLSAQAHVLQDVVGSLLGTINGGAHTESNLQNKIKVESAKTSLKTETQPKKSFSLGLKVGKVKKQEEVKKDQNHVEKHHDGKASTKKENEEYIPKSSSSGFAA